MNSVLKYFGNPWLYHTIKTNCIKISDCWSSNMLNFVFLEKTLGIVYSPNFVYEFSRKYLSCYILLTDKISLSDWLLGILGNMYIVNSLPRQYVCIIGQYVQCNYLLSSLWRLTFEIKFSPLIKPFFYMTKKPGQKIKYLKNEKGF